MGVSWWPRLAVVVSSQVMLASAAFASPIDLTTGTPGRFESSQSFNETRASDVTVLNPAGLVVTNLRLDRLQNAGACSTRVGARVYDSVTGNLLATSDAFVHTTTSVSLPIEVGLESAHDYRIGFYVETTPPSLGSGGLFLSNPPYVEATGNVRVNFGYSFPADVFPEYLNLGQPHTTLEATTGTLVDRPLTDARLVLRRRASGAAQLELRSRDPRLPFPVAGSPDDPANGMPGGLVLELFSLHEGDGRITIPHEAAGADGWVARPGVYRFRNAAAPAGSTPVRTLELRDGTRRTLKIVAKAVPLPLTTVQSEIGVRITMGSTRLCARFTSAGIHRDDPGTFVADASLSLASCSERTVRPAARCGDGVCQASESCDRCFSDCGPCPGPTVPPLLPLAIDLAAFDTFIASRDCATLPISVRAPDATAASCWVGSIESADDLIAYLPQACCAGAVCGGGLPFDYSFPYATEVVTTRNNGTTFLSVLGGCLAANPPVTTFLMPTLFANDQCDYGIGYVQTVVPVTVTDVVADGPDAGITVLPFCGPGICGFGFCAEGATCETCNWECAPPD